MSHNPNWPTPYAPEATTPAGYQVGPPSYPAPSPYRQRPRSWGKTFIVSILLTLLPFVGSAMAPIYIYTRKHPELYDGWAAFAAVMLYVLNLLIVAGIIGLIVVILMAA
jgi:hypothetical protein